MPRKKQNKILEVDSLPNVFHTQPEESTPWLTDYLPQGKPLILEIGCGRGDYTIKLAQAYPNQNFVGVDVKGARLWTGAKWASQLQVNNVAFLRARAELLYNYFEENQVAEIWIPFPDPFPKTKNTKWRVTSPAFLNANRQILKKGGRVHLKTDNLAFYEYTLGELKKHNFSIHHESLDIYNNSGLTGAVIEIQTKYEKQHLADGRTIKYICFGFE